MKRVALALLIASLLSLLAVAAGIFINQSSARPDEGPDPAFVTRSRLMADDYPNLPRRAAFVVSRNQYVTVDNSIVKIFVKPSVSVLRLRIDDKNICENQSPTQPLYDADNVYGTHRNGEAMNYFRLIGARGELADAATGVYSTATDCTSNSTTLVADSSQGRYVASLDMREFTLKAGVLAGANGFTNSYKLEVMSDNNAISQDAIISLDANNGAPNLGMQTIYPVPNNSNQSFSRWEIPFAPSCDINQRTEVSIKIYDDDNQGEGGAQPANKPFLFKVQEFDSNNNFVRTINLNRVVTSSPNGTKDRQANDWWRVASGEDKGTISAYFNVRPNFKYRWQVERIYYNNTLQFQIPYDSVYYYADCIKPYKLNPVIERSPGAVAIAPEDVSFKFFISNQTQNRGQTKYSILIRTGTGEVVYRNENQGPVDVPGSRRIAVDSGNWTRPSSTAWGGRICATLTIFEADENGTDDKTESCISVGKRPHVQIRNGDTRIGGSYPQADGSCPVPTAEAEAIGFGSGSLAGRSFGNWTEYGLMSLGKIDGFGSAGQPRDISSGNRLSFSNTQPETGYYYGTASSVDRCVTDMFAKYGNRPTQALATNSIDLSNMTTGAYRATDGDTLFINASSVIPSGRDIIVMAENIVIENDIRYGNEFAAVEEIPRIILLANGTITIKSGVTQADGWLISKKELFTCEETQRLTTGLCDKQLRVNGPVIAGELVLRRTFGGGSGNAAEPAEIFNLRTDALLQINNESMKNSRPETQFLIELPPRF